MKKQFCQWMQFVQVTTTTNKNLQVKVIFSKTKLSFLLVFLKEMIYGLPVLLLNFQEKKTICVQSINKNKVSETPMSYIRQKSSLLLLYSNDGWSVLDHSALKIENKTLQEF